MESHLRMSRPASAEPAASLGKDTVRCFAQNTRDEVRFIGGNVAGALAANPGMKQTNYLMRLIWQTKR